MPYEWYYASGGSQSGPFSTEQVGARLAADGFPADALVWREGFENWRRPEEVPEFQRKRKSVPPPLPQASPHQPGTPSYKSPPVETLVMNFKRKPFVGIVGVVAAGAIALLVAGPLLGILSLLFPELRLTSPAVVQALGAGCAGFAIIYGGRYIRFHDRNGYGVKWLFNKISAKLPRK
ncbi:MAG: DUF4339 domain-containing protein, partial [Alphaproteobacteria bacterium]|nr:DUF4339 domain-containing protein [Alphaproteobacteria bacterium]